MAVKKIKNYNIHQNPATNENQFDVENYLNENWNKTKEVVNNNADEIIDIQGKISALETDNTTNKQNISEIKQEQQTQNSDIKNLQTNDVKQDELISKLKNVALNAETEEAKSLYVTDANRFGSLEVLGNQEQKTSEQGKNYFTGNKIASGTEKGVTYSFDNSIFKMNGTTTATGNIILDADTGVKLPAGTYTFTVKKLTGDYTRPSGQDFALYLRNKNDFITGDYITSGITGNNLQNSSGIFSKQIIITEETEIYFRFYASNADIVLNNLELGIQIEIGSKYTEFEQFVPNMPSPNYPSEVVCLGSNKNIFDGTNKNYYINQQVNYCGVLGGNSGSIIDVKGKSNVTISSSIVQTRFRAGCVNSEVTDAYAHTIYNGVNKDNGTEMTINCEGYNYLVINATDLSKIKIEQGTKATPYSPYNMGSVEIDVGNKNWLKLEDIEETTSKGITYSCKKGILKIQGTATAGFQINLAYNIVLKPNTYNHSVNTIIKGLYLSFDNTHDTMLSQQNGITTTFNIDIEKTYSKYFLWIDPNTTVDLELKPQLEIGEQATSYVEHQSQTKILPIQQEMLSGDYFVKEADGWKEVHNIGIYETDKEDDWQMNTSGLYFLYSAIKSSNTNNTALSTHFKFNSITSGITSLADGEFALQPQYENNPIYCRDNSSATLQDFKNRLATEKVKFYYNLVNPTKLPCTEEQSAVLEELNNLDLYKPVTNIITAEDIALLKLKYALDVETYIDNKLNTINQQILNIAGGN